MSVKEGKQDYGIQPFQIQEDEDVVNFLERTTWFEAMTKVLQKHSEFMQPQANNGDYPGMEYAYPDYTNPNELPPGDGASLNINPSGGCVLSCYAPLYCYEPVECHFSVSQTPFGMNPLEASAHWQMEAREVNPTTSPPLVGLLVSGDRLSIVSHQTDSDIDKIIAQQNAGHTLPKGSVMNRKLTEGVAAVRDSIYMLRVSPPSGGWPHWPENRPTLLSVRAMDAAGNICQTKVSVFCREEDCCNKPDHVAMTFDNDSTADTVARNNSITVFVLDGCGPYTWSVTGTGFSFVTSQTSSGQNTLLASGSACGNGVVTVTDMCGTSVQGTILCTTGNYHQTCYETAAYIGTCCAEVYPIGGGYATKWFVNCSCTTGVNTLCGATGSMVGSPRFLREAWKCDWGCEDDDCWFA